jgi:predicted nucleic acid-binding protein
VRLVLDSSVLIAAMKPSEPHHAAAVDFLARLRASLAVGAAFVFAPPELWFELHVAQQRLALSRSAKPPVDDAMDGLAVELTAPADTTAITGFLAHLAKRMRGRRPSVNGTDLAYLWAAWSEDATVVTLDEGLLKYHGVVCDVTRPQHVRVG